MSIKEICLLLVIIVLFLGAMFLMWREIFRTTKSIRGKLKKENNNGI